VREGVEECGLGGGQGGRGGVHGEECTDFRRVMKRIVRFLSRFAKLLGCRGLAGEPTRDRLVLISGSTAPDRRTRAKATRHYIQYHNSAKIGGPPRELFRIFTNKPAPRDVIEARVWLVLGDGLGASRYTLHSTFIADSVGPTDEPGFSSEVRGTEGKQFTPAISLDDEYWFADLQSATGNFAFGFTSVTGKNRIIGGLRTVGQC
jgi:hypothetical protein